MLTSEASILKLEREGIEFVVMNTICSISSMCAREVLVASLDQ